MLRTLVSDRRCIRPARRGRRRGFHSNVTARLLLAALAAASVACGSGDDGTSIEAIRQLHKERKFEASIEPLREALKRQPENAELNFMYGQALVQSGHANLANWSLRKAMKDPDWKVPAALQLAFLSLNSRDFNEVIEITDQVLEIEPESAQAHLMRASAYAHWKKDPELAIEEADRVLEIDPDKIEAYEPRIIALLDLGRVEEARASLAEAGERAKEVGTTEEVLAWHCSTTAALDEYAGDLEQARATWLECLEKYPSSPDVVGDAVTFYDKYGEPDRALEVLEVAAQDGSRGMRVSLANRLMSMGRAADGEALLREATRAEAPEQAASAWLDLANLQQAIGDAAAAADSLERSVAAAREVGEPDPSLLFQYADALLVAGDLDRALEVGEALPVAAHRQMIRARVAQARGDDARALAEFEEALRLWPDNTYARYFAAVAAESLGDFDRAIEEYRYSIRIAPGATDARVRCARLLEESRHYLEAAEVLHSVYASAPLGLEGELMGLRYAGLTGQTEIVAAKLDLVRQRWPSWIGEALASAAEGVAMRGGPGLALSMLMSAPGVDYAQPAYVPALRALVEYAHAADGIDAIRERLDAIYATRPDDGFLQEVRARDLELSGAPADDVRAAYTRAVELKPGYAPALEGRGRVALRDGDLEAAIDFFDRAGAADPSDPDPRVEAARLRVELGRVDEAAAVLDAVLDEQSWAGRAAAARVAIDLSRGSVSERTRDLATRAVRFGGGADDLEALAKVYAALGDAELAQQARDRAKRVREAAARAAS
jgi:tetratricopeptide (TPR) repeat protein